MRQYIGVRRVQARDAVACSHFLTQLSPDLSQGDHFAVFHRRIILQMGTLPHAASAYKADFHFRL